MRTSYANGPKGFAWWHLRSAVTAVSAAGNAILFIVVTCAVARRGFMSRRHPNWSKNERKGMKEQVRCLGKF